MADRSSDPAPTTTSATPAEELFPPPTVRKSLFSRWMNGTVGVLLIVIGIILGILPVVPGFPLIAVGVLMVVASHEPSRRLLNRSERMIPRRLRVPVRKFLRKISPRR